MAGIMLVATLVILLFAVVIGVASERLEHGLLDQIVIKEFGEIQRRLAVNPDAHLPNTAQLRTWLTDSKDDKSLPASVRKLAVGVFHEIDIEGSEYHVLREPVDDRFLTLAYEINLVESRESQLNIILLITVIIGPLLVLWFSYFFTQRMTRPVIKLASKLSELDPSKRNVRLGDDFQGNEVEAIAQAFDRYQERLDLMVEREQSFTAAASHELRTPLAVISASTELLEVNPDLPASASKQLQRISSAVSMMNDLVSSLLALARERKQKPTSPLHLQPIIDGAIANFQSQLDDKAVTLEYHCDPELTMWISTGDLLILLGNLVQNAIRNTSSGKVSVYCEAHRLVVKDTGRGMPREFAEHIFDKHVQAQDSHGVGLGLHIVKRLCDRYGWEIEVESVLGEGTCVIVNWASIE